MGMAKAGYREAYRGVTAVKVPITADGNIAQDGDTVAGTKRFQVSQVNAENDLDANNKVLDLFIGLIAGGSHDTLTNTMRVNWKV